MLKDIRCCFWLHVGIMSMSALCQRSQTLRQSKHRQTFVCLAYQGNDIVFRFVIEYSSLRDFGPWVIGLFLYEDF
jgi:hypothetical protein